MAFDRRCLWSNMGGVEGSLDDGLTKFNEYNGWASPSNTVK